MDRRLKTSLDSSHEVMTVSEKGWSGKDNGDLLRSAEKEFDAIITLDKNMRYQQRLEAFDLVFILVEARSNRK